VSGDYNARVATTPDPAGPQRHPQRHQSWWGEGQVFTPPHTGRQGHQQAWTSRGDGPGREEQLEVFSGAQAAEWGDAVGPRGATGGPRGIQPSRHRLQGPGRMGGHVSPAVLPGARKTQEEHRPSWMTRNTVRRKRREVGGAQGSKEAPVRCGRVLWHQTCTRDEMQGPETPGHQPRYMS
jgi:hypothetical protein